MSKRLQLNSDDYYKYFGEQPDLIEINIGYKLIPCVDENNQKSLIKEIRCVRNRFDAEYGLLLPVVSIRDSMYLEPDEYAILLSGNEIAKSSLWYGTCFCLDTGSVRKTLDTTTWEKVKEPVYGMDAFIIPEKDVEVAHDAGYLCLYPENVIRTHLYEIVKKNITKILNQSMVIELVEKVRKINPDVITDVFITKGFLISNMKIVLNRLLEEGISIRDMNTILETIAEYVNEEKKPLVLAEKVRERLAPCFIKEYSKDGKNLHVFEISKSVSENLVEHLYFPESKVENAYLALDPIDRKKLFDGISRSCSWFIVHNLPPVFACVSQLRPYLANYLHGDMPGVHVISDLELYAAKKLVTVTAEGEVEFDD